MYIYIYICICIYIYIYICIYIYIYTYICPAPPGPAWSADRGLLCVIIRLLFIYYYYCNNDMMIIIMIKLPVRPCLALLALTVPPVSSLALLALQVCKPCRLAGSLPGLWGPQVCCLSRYLPCCNYWLTYLVPRGPSYPRQDATCLGAHRLLRPGQRGEQLPPPEPYSQEAAYKIAMQPGGQATRRPGGQAARRLGSLAPR